MKINYFPYIVAPMPAKPLNPHELAEAAELKKLFKLWQKMRADAGTPVSQESAAALLGFGQSALSQYLNGNIPLNIDAAVVFARELGASVEQFSPSIADRIRAAALLVGREPGLLADARRPMPATTPRLAPAAPPWFDAEVYRLLDLYYASGIDERRQIMGYAEQLSPAAAKSVIGNQG